MTFDIQSATAAQGNSAPEARSAHPQAHDEKRSEQVQKDARDVLRATTETILTRLLQADHGESDLAAVPALLTQWWRDVVAMELPIAEKERAARALAYFRTSYRELPRLTAMELRLRSKRILNIGRNARIHTAVRLAAEPAAPQRKRDASTSLTGSASSSDFTLGA